jgi:phosphate transport system substrate-binding protein
VKGSTSLVHFFQEIEQAFEDQYDSIDIKVEDGGSIAGVAGLIKQEVDIALSSDGSLESMFDLSKYKKEIVAIDAIVIGVGNSSFVKQLSNQQIKEIFNGTMKNWQEMGLNDLSIVPVIRDQNSGTQRFFSDCFNIERCSDKAVVADSNAEVISILSEIKGSIGFFGIEFFHSSINGIQVYSNENKDYVAPSYYNLLNGDYPLKRNLSVYYLPNSEKEVLMLIRFLKSKEGQTILATNGLIPVDLENGLKP